MPKITYNPGPGDAQEVTWGNQKFKAGEAVDTDNPVMLAKAQNNPFFEVGGGEKKGGQNEKAEIIGNYQDAFTGAQVDLVKRQRLYDYGPGMQGPAEISKPSSATQGSVAIESSRPLATGGTNPKFRETFGVTQEELAKGDYEGAPEPKGPEGTVGKGETPYAKEAKQAQQKQKGGK